MTMAPVRYQAGASGLPVRSVSQATMNWAEPPNTEIAKAYIREGRCPRFGNCTFLTERHFLPPFVDTRREFVEALFGIGGFGSF